MESEPHNLAASKPTVTTPSSAVLDHVAAQMRCAGLFMALANRAGEVVYHDEEAHAVYHHAVLPNLKASSDLRSTASSLSPTSGVILLPATVGFVAAVVPYFEKRGGRGALIVSGLTDRALADASHLPVIDGTVLWGYANLMHGMVHDQVRLGGLEQELNSLSGQLANSYEELSLIYQVSGGMKVNRTPFDFFKQACLDVLDVINVRGMGVALCGEGSCRQPPALFGDLQLPQDELSRLADELMDVLRERKSPLLINDLANDRRFGWATGSCSQLLAVPLQRQEQVLGCLFAIDKSKGEFDSVDSKLLNSIANESAIYLENAHLFEDVRDLMMGMLHSLTSAVDAKDAYTCGHSERVALLSQRLAVELGLAPQLVERIYMAGILHDVGKIGVPEAVLQKAGKLTNEEFEQMKRHPEIGARILQDIKQVADIIPGVLHHHERYDGRGYPHKLSGNNIPLMGRIICLADCFDAMTSNRTYRRALPLEVAMIEIRRCAGTQFDPTLAEAFLRINPDEFKKLVRDHQAQSRQRTETIVPPIARAA